MQVCGSVIPWPLPKQRTLPAVHIASVPHRIADRVSVSENKMAIDGTFVEQSAATRAPYPGDSSSRGKINFSAADLRTMFLEARRRKQQLVLHICGDRAIDAVLTVLEESGGSRAWSGQRIRFEHANQLASDHFARAKALGIIAVMNPPHLMMGDTQLLRSVVDSGIPLALASDNAMNPFLNLRYATEYPRNAREAVTMEQAIIAYTSVPADSELAEKHKGTLEPGKFADLAVLSANIFEVTGADLAKTESMLTVVGGTIVHAHPPFTLR
jgi:predicted amidohydrolase YtcJ